MCRGGKRGLVMWPFEEEGQTIISQRYYKCSLQNTANKSGADDWLNTAGGFLHTLLMLHPGQNGAVGVDATFRFGFGRVLLQ